MNRSNSEDIEIGISAIRKIIETVKQYYGFDLSIYAGTSLKRRLSKVMHQNDITNPDELVSTLISRPDFFNRFQTQMVVDGTEFFRDPAFWRSLRSDICKNLQQSGPVKIKIWLPGCASGEEVLSTAITLKEAGLYDKSIIYATDLKQEIIDMSRNKIYSNSILEISENNYKRFREDESAALSAYYTSMGSGFIFHKNLYENIVYDVFDDRDTRSVKTMNMILYRNKFIYFNAQYQDKLLELFTERLTLNGYFAIGNKENISFCKDFKKYTAVNEIEKIYRKISN
jgi:chemotaxis protein methyltransferase CheR